MTGEDDFESRASASSATPAQNKLEACLLKAMEAPPRFELGIELLQSCALPLGYGAVLRWSGRRESNPRPSPWQGDALPLSHVREMAGDIGFEPMRDGVKVRCLTAWLIPNAFQFKIWGDRWDLNPRMPEPQSGALTPSPRPPYDMKY